MILYLSSPGRIIADVQSGRYGGVRPRVHAALLALAAGADSVKEVCRMTGLSERSARRAIGEAEAQAKKFRPPVAVSATRGRGVLT